VFFLFKYEELKKKVDDLTELYQKIKTETDERNRALEETLGVSEKFWDDLNEIQGTLKDIEEGLVFEEGIAFEPNAIREQQDLLEVEYSVGSDVVFPVSVCFAKKCHMSLFSSLRCNYLYCFRQ